MLPVNNLQGRRQMAQCPGNRVVHVPCSSARIHLKYTVLYRRQAVCRASTSNGNGATTVQADADVQDVVVVGGGICGLTSALALKTQHGDKVSKFLVTEARERVGGNITTVSDDKFIWEEGPNSFTPNDAILTAAVDAGVADQLVLGDPQAPRFVFWEGKLRPVPSSPLSGITFDLMSFPGKIRAGLGAIGLFKAPPPASEESVEQFIKRNLGQEVFYRLIEPFCSGVYAGDPSKLSMKAAFGRIQVLEEKGGSLVGGAMKLMQERKQQPQPERDPRLPPKPQGQTVGSFRRGLKTLPEGMEKQLDGHIRLEVWLDVGTDPALSKLLWSKLLV